MIDIRDLGFGKLRLSGRSLFEIEVRYLPVRLGARRHALGIGRRLPLRRGNAGRILETLLDAVVTFHRGLPAPR